jgi:hypothetical protein
MDVGVTICKYGSRTTVEEAGRLDATNKQRVIHNLIMLTVSPLPRGELVYFIGRISLRLVDEEKITCF